MEAQLGEETGGAHFWLWGWGKGFQTEQCRQPLESGKGKEMGCKPADIMILSTDVDFSFCPLELNNAFLF